MVLGRVDPIEDLGRKSRLKEALLSGRDTLADDTGHRGDDRPGRDPERDHAAGTVLGPGRLVLRGDDVLGDPPL